MKRRVRGKEFPQVFFRDTTSVFSRSRRSVGQIESYSDSGKLRLKDPMSKYWTLRLDNRKLLLFAAEGLVLLKLSASLDATYRDRAWEGALTLPRQEANQTRRSREELFFVLQFLLSEENFCSYNYPISSVHDPTERSYSHTLLSTTNYTLRFPLTNSAECWEYFAKSTNARENGPPPPPVEWRW